MSMADWRRRRIVRHAVALGAKIGNGDLEPASSARGHNEDLIGDLDPIHPVRRQVEK
ncbi:MAG: hypothetical protein MZU97_26425 [Bacillus subtilis]|nr:hypothetical protein [Bacillus subtilis]